jgi:hypothetical protein
MSVDLLRLPLVPEQFAIKPDWEKIWSLGFQEVYTISHRSTESLEMLQGGANVKAQQSVHFVLQRL